MKVGPFYKGAVLCWGSKYGPEVREPTPWTIVNRMRLWGLLYYNSLLQQPGPKKFKLLRIDLIYKAEKV